MDQKTRNYISKFLILAFLFFLLPSDNYISAGNERDGLKKIKAAEKLFIKYKYRESINKYIEAEEIVKSGKNLSRLYMGLSKAYYALGLEARTREVIRKIADLTFQSKVDETKLPRGYLKIYKEILARILKEKEAEKIAKIKKEKEESKIVRTEEKITELKPEIIVKDTEKPDKQVIERPGKKKKGKKSSILPIIGGALALGAAAFLLTKKKDPGDSGSNTASIHIESTPSNATVFVDGANKGTTPCDITVSEGSREILLLIGGWGETTKTQTFSKDQSYSLNAVLSPYIYLSALTFSITKPPSYYSFPHGIDLDDNDNLYSCVYSDLGTGVSYLLKYSNSGTTLFIKKVFNAGSVTICKFVGAIYSQYYNGNTFINKFNLNGDFLNTVFKLKGDVVRCKDVDEKGNIVVITGAQDLRKYSSGGGLLKEIKNIVTFANNLKSMKISSDEDLVYLGCSSTNQVFKYSWSNGIVKQWSSQNEFVFNGEYINGFGDEDQEKIFISANNGSRGRVEIYNGEGEFLTKTSDGNFERGITVDDNGNLYVLSNDWEITRYEPSSETEGSGTWTVASKLKRSNRSGFSNGISNTRKLQKRVDRNAIKKELKDKKEGKRIR
ncbi:MAG: PEGA domain-containing protein [Acidobacteriota bacterium]